MSPTRTRRPPSPACLQLAAAGTTQTQLARVLKVSQMSASRYLAGERDLPDGFEAKLAQLVGDKAARAIVGAIPGREAVAA